MSYQPPAFQQEMTFTDVLLKPNGRIAQKEYWMGIGAIIGGNILSGFIPFLGFFLSIFLIYVGCCVYGKRLHDAGKTAWLHAIPWGVTTVITIIGFVFAAPLFIEFMQFTMEIEPGAEPELSDFSSMFQMFVPVLIASSISSLIWLGYTIWVGVLGSDPQTNRFGARPHAMPQQRRFKRCAGLPLTP